MFRGEPLSERSQLRPGVGERHAGGETAEDVGRSAASRPRVRGVGVEWQPELVRRGERVSLRHHADHGGKAAPQLYRASHDARVGTEPLCPHLVAQEHHGRRSRPFVRLGEHAAEHGACGCDAERGGGDLRPCREPGAAIRAHEVDAGVAVRAEVRDGLHGPPELVVVQHRLLVLERLRIQVHDADDAVAVGERQLRARQYPEHLEDDGSEPDAEGHREAADDGESGVLHEHPEAQLQVERQSAQPRGAAAFAKRLTVLLHAAEGDEGAPPGLVAVELQVAHEALRFHVYMEADLVVYPGVGGAGREKAQAGAGGVEPAHETVVGE
jgi:hypothetical protein